MLTRADLEDLQHSPGYPAQIIDPIKSPGQNGYCHTVLIVLKANKRLSNVDLFYDAAGRSYVRSRGSRIQLVRAEEFDLDQPLEQDRSEPNLDWLERRPG